MTETTRETTAVIELVQLESGDIALRRLDLPEHPMVTINFSNIPLDLIDADKMQIAKAMVEAGIQRFGELQVQRVAEAQKAAKHTVLH